MMHEKWEYAFMKFIGLAATLYPKEVKTALHFGFNQMGAESERTTLLLSFHARAKMNGEHVVFRALYEISNSLCKLRPRTHHRIGDSYEDMTNKWFISFSYETWNNAPKFVERIR